jgi:triphosphoribosyl-dephospho-CoA synthase
LAAVWEVTAAKPGNVYRGADFEDVTFADFVTSAVAVGPALTAATEQGVGLTVLRAIQAARQAVGTNTNLGIILLLAPLAAVHRDRPLKTGIAEILAQLTPVDTQHVYRAIRLARPGGLGSAEVGDARHEHDPVITLLEAMRLASNRDLIARQYTTEFVDVFKLADAIALRVADGWSLESAIIYEYVYLLSRQPDTLIARKCGFPIAEEASIRAETVWQSGVPGEASYHAALADLDFWLRSDGHRRNPGTSADLVAAALFVLLRDQRLHWPVRFY